MKFIFRITLNYKKEKRLKKKIEKEKLTKETHQIGSFPSQSILRKAFKN